MEKILEEAVEFAGQVKDYVNNRISLAKLELAEKTSKLVSVIIAASMVLVFIVLFMIFLGMAAANVLSVWIGSAYAGSLIVAGIYFLAAIIFWKRREIWIRLPVMNAILKQFFADEKD